MSKLNNAAQKRDREVVVARIVHWILVLDDSFKFGPIRLSEVSFITIHLPNILKYHENEGHFVVIRFDGDIEPWESRGLFTEDLFFMTPPIVTHNE